MDDEELKATLALWKARKPSGEIAERTWTAFGKRRRLGWKRAMHWHVNVPVPVAALAGLVILALGAWAGVALRPRTVPQIVVQTRTVPVVVEKVVTRKVVIRERAPSYKVSSAPLTLAGFRPVSQIELEVIRRN